MMPVTPGAAFPGRRCGPRARSGGFTLVELVIVMLLMAILTGLGATRFASTDAFAAQGLADRLTANLRSAQSTAMAQRRTLHIIISDAPAAMQVCLDAACTQPLPPPGTDDTWLPDAPSLRLNTSASFQITPAGGTDLATALQLQVLGGSAPTPPALRIEPASGHVRRL